jgi:putative peptide zinc metalloprotease protein
MLPHESRRSAMDLCPSQSYGIESHGSDLVDAVAVLKDPVRWMYFKLSAIGASVWKRIDGTKSVQMLLDEVTAELPGTPPGAILRVLGQLRRFGFLQFGVSDSVPVPARVRWRIAHPLVWEVSIQRCDFAFELLYRYGGKFFFSRLFMLPAAACGVLGLLIFLCGDPAGSLAGHSSELLYLVLTGFCTVLLHECAHGLTVKHFGKQVGGVGISWFWFGPAFFVETSDMWLSTRKKRIAVSLAGPAVEFVLAGVAGAGALILGQHTCVSTVLRTYSAISYYRLLFNLCPLLEYDGYFVLCDLLHQSNLRRRAYDLLRTRGWRVRKDSASECMLLGYCVASLIYILVLGFVTAVAVRQGVEHWSVKLVSPSLASSIALTACIAFGLLVVVGALWDFLRQSPHTT